MGCKTISVISMVVGAGVLLCAPDIVASTKIDRSFAGIFAAHYRHLTEATPLREDTQALRRRLIRRALRHTRSVDSFQASMNLTATDLQATTFCNPPISPSSCNFASLDRTFDGSCNNVNKPDWGRSNTPFVRLTPGSWANSKFDAKTEFNTALPNPRTVSTTACPSSDVLNLEQTNLVTEFGQFLNHDMNRAANPGLSCCSSGTINTECLDIDCRNDPISQSIGRKCMDFSRSTPYCFNTNSPSRDPFTVVSHFVDLSQCYGSTKDVADCLRERRGGRMLMGPSGTPPTVQMCQNNCNLKTFPFGVTFCCGDNRCDEMPALTAQHWFWLRIHNWYADEICKKNFPSWSDEKCYQEARHLTIGTYHCVLLQWIEAMLGPTVTGFYGLSRTLDQQTVYEPDVEPSSSVESMTAALRCGHSITISKFNMQRKFGDPPVRTFQLKESFNNPETVMFNGGEGFSLIMSGMVGQTRAECDNKFSDDVHNFLFTGSPDRPGLDLVAINIQRCRDHGVRSYNDYRTLCGLTPLTTWDKQPSEISSEAWTSMAKTYRSPLDIDLFVGGVSEKRFLGALAGPTFTCILADHCTRMVYGDRFFFTHSTSGYRLDQVNKVCNLALPRFLCKFTNITTVPENPFKIPSSTNPLISCTDPRLQLDVRSCVRATSLP